MRIDVLLRLALCLAAIVSPVVARAIEPEARCEEKRLVAAARVVRSLVLCRAKAVARGVAPDASCTTKARNTFLTRYALEESRGSCLFVGRAEDVLSAITDLDATLGDTIAPGAPRSICASQELRAASALADKLLREQGKHGKQPSRMLLGAAVAKASARYEKSFARAKTRLDCVTSGNRDTVATQVDAAVGEVVDLVRGALKTASPRPLMGAAVRAGVLASSDDAYRRTILRQVDSVTLEFELMWGNLEPVRGAPDYGPPDTTLDFAEQNGLAVRGAPLVWHQIVPSWLATLTPVELQEAVDQRIADVVGRYRGRIRAWDVVNEAVQPSGSGLRDTIFLQKLGPGYIADAFRAAHAADPDALLFYNDFSMEDLGAKSDFAYAMVQDLLAQDVPIHGVSFQGHLGGGLFSFGSFPPNSLRQNMQRFADLGLVVSLTEIDVQKRTFPGREADRLLRQAELYHSIVSDCVSVPACESITFWGLTDRYTWIRDFLFLADAPLPFDEAYVPKPAFFAIRDALLGR